MNPNLNKIFFGGRGGGGELGTAGTRVSDFFYKESKTKQFFLWGEGGFFCGEGGRGGG